MINYQRYLKQIFDNKIAFLSKNEEQLMEELAQIINQLIEKDFPKLVQILYRIDISEKKLKQKLADADAESAGKTIALLIIERQKQKELFKKQHSSSSHINLDEEKW